MLFFFFPSEYDSFTKIKKKKKCRTYGDRCNLSNRFARRVVLSSQLRLLRLHLDRFKLLLLSKLFRDGKEEENDLFAAHFVSFASNLASISFRQRKLEAVPLARRVATKSRV